MSAWTKLWSKYEQNPTESIAFNLFETGSVYRACLRHRMMAIILNVFCILSFHRREKSEIPLVVIACCNEIERRGICTLLTSINKQYGC